MPPTRPVPVTDRRSRVVVERLETPGTVNFDVRRSATTRSFGVSESRNRRGPFAGPIQVALIDPLSPPEKVDVSYTADAISLTWPAQPEDVRGRGAAGATGARRVRAATADRRCGRCTVMRTPTAPMRRLFPSLDRETDGTVELYADLETEGTAGCARGGRRRQDPNRRQAEAEARRRRRASSAEVWLQRV